MTLELNSNSSGFYLFFLNFSFNISIYDMSKCNMLIINYLNNLNYLTNQGIILYKYNFDDVSGINPESTSNQF